METHNNPPFQPRSIEDYQNILAQLKLKAANQNGSVSQILSDVNSDWHNNVAMIIKQIFLEKQALETQLAAKMQELEKVYNSNPDLKIRMEKDQKSPKKVK